MALGAHLHLCSRTISRQGGIVSFPHPSPEVSTVQFNIIRSFLCLEPRSPDFQQGIFKYTMFHSILKFICIFYQKHMVQISFLKSYYSFYTFLLWLLLKC